MQVIIFDSATATYTGPVTFMLNFPSGKKKPYIFM